MGAKWFVDRYARFGIEFDRIIMFEYSVKSPRKIFKDLDAKLISKMSYFNVGVKSNSKSPINPWNVLMELARPVDYVCIKLDIDTPRIENALVDQLMHNETLLGLVDELFYEHHVDSWPMRGYWGKLRKNIVVSNESERGENSTTLRTWYALFGI